MSHPLKPPAIAAERRANRRRTSDHSTIALMRLDEVLATCALGRTSVYEAIQQGIFPAPIAVYGRTKRWVRQEIQDWLTARIAAQHAPEGHPGGVRHNKT